VQRPGTNLTDRDLLQHCQEHLARFKRPESIQFLDELPKNSLGKVLKQELRKQFEVS